MSFTSSVWTLHIISVITLESVQALSTKLTINNSDVILRFLEMLQLTLLQWFQTKYLNKLSNCFLYILETVYGMVMGSLYCCCLGSIFITNSDVSKYPVICKSDMLTELHSSFPQGFNSKFLEVSTKQYWRHIRALDINYGYSIDNVCWRKLDRIQQLASTNVFKK